MPCTANALGLREALLMVRYPLWQMHPKLSMLHLRCLMLQRYREIHSRYRGMSQQKSQQANLGRQFESSLPPMQVCLLTFPVLDQEG
jgi:hypothetical protein